jgi:hypothetical protein
LAISYAVHKYNVRKFYEHCEVHDGRTQEYHCDRCGILISAFCGHQCKGRPSKRDLLNQTLEESIQWAHDQEQRKGRK